MGEVKIPDDKMLARTFSEDLSLHEVREKIQILEDEFSKLPQIAIETNHYFSKGVYAREIKAPSGSILIGKIHKHENLNILSQGEISVFSIDGMSKIKAPATIVSSPGVKRVAYVHDDVIWTTIHGTDETDLDKIEEEFIAKTYDDVQYLSNSEEKKCLG